MQFTCKQVADQLGAYLLQEMQLEDLSTGPINR